MEALRANAEREWRAQTEQMRADEERVEAAGEALKSLMSVVDHFDEGCITVAAHLRRLERSEVIPKPPHPTPHPAPHTSHHTPHPIPHTRTPEP